MQRPHLIIGPAALLAIVLGATALLADPGPVPTSSAALIAAGLVVAGVTALAGLLLARAPWGRWALTGLVVGAMGLASVGSTWLTWATYGVGAMALVGLVGPWLALWTRHGRLAEAPGPVVVGLQSVAAGTPLAIGLATIDSGARWYHWVLVVVTMAASILYGRGNAVGRWSYRTVVPLFALAVGVATGGVGGIVIAAAGIAIGVLAWTPAARRATAVIAPVLPTPVARGER